MNPGWDLRVNLSKCKCERRLKKKKLFSFTDTTNLMTSNHIIVTHRASCMFNKKRYYPYIALLMTLSDHFRDVGNPFYLH